MLNEAVSNLKIPVVTTMLAADVPGGFGGSEEDKAENSYGFIGAYGSRTANFIVAKCDLLICLGARLDVRQTGAYRKNFAPDAKIIRIDIDEGELSYKVHEDEIGILADVKAALKFMSDLPARSFPCWLKVCDTIKQELDGIDDRLPNLLVRRISEVIPGNAVITTDVGQNQVWTAQSFEVKPGQRIFFSGGHGAMGYSLPAAIGCAESSKNGRVFAFTGDGGIQMNIQELQVISRENLPVKIVLFNNSALGMIRHFQEMYFESNYVQTVPEGGFTNPDFEGIAKAYKIPYRLITKIDEIDDKLFDKGGAQFVEVRIDEPTYVFPKLQFGMPNQDQEPLLGRQTYERIMNL